ncbi:MAG: TRAP transporter large permease subunit, partial [Alphaproteobacteria bacterium]|nr:TRAP transporter large permease subunit [Alphaproteobacteria bacterium]
LIVLADQLGRSVGDMYAGAIIPGLLLTAIYCLYVLAVSIFQPSKVPALPPAARTLNGSPVPLLILAAGATLLGFAAHWFLLERLESGADIWAAAIAIATAYGLALADKRMSLGLLSQLTQRVVIVLIPPLALIFLVLGTIFLGIATPTEGGAMGAAGALAMAMAKKRLSFRLTSEALDATARLSCFVLFILIGSRIFSLTFYGINGHIWVEELFAALPGGAMGFLIAVSLLVFILGCFIDFFEIAFIVVPLLAPVASKLGIDLVWFGVLLGVNLQTSFLTPPFGFALFYMRSVASARDYIDRVTGDKIAGIKTTQIYRGAVAFIVLQVVMIGITVTFPGIAIRDTGPKIDPNSVEIEIPMPGFDGQGTDGIPAPPDFSTPPSFN